MRLLVIILLWLITVLLSKIIFEERQLIKSCLDGSILFLLGYCFISSFLIMLNCFKVESAIVIQYCISVLLLFLNSKKYKRIYNIKKIYKSELILIALIMLLIPFVFKKSEIVETACDAGMYMEKAIALIGNDRSNQIKLSEYGVISPDVDTGLLELQSIQVGLYGNIDDGEYQYEYHGIYTWPALLALAAWATSIYDATSILTVLYLLSLLLIYYIASRICENRWGKFLAVVLFGFSPLYIYLAKTSLSEMLFVTVLLCALYGISSINKRKHILFPILIGMLGFIHFSTLLYMPLFYIVLFILCFQTKRREYGYYNIMQLIIYGISVLYCYYTSHKYTYGQICNMFGTGTNVALFFIILAFCIIMGICLQFFLLKKISNDSAIICRFGNWILNNKFTIIMRIIFSVVLVATIYQGYMLCYTDKYSEGNGNWALRVNYANKGLQGALHLNLVTVIILTAYICIPYIIYILMRKKIDKTKYILLFIAVAYSLCIYTIIRCDTPSLYYAARYFSIVMIPAIILLTCSLINTYKTIILIGCVCVITQLPFNLVHLDGVGFQGDYELLQDVTSTIGEESVVLVETTNRKLNIVAVNNLREINNCMVYNYANYEEVINYYSDKGKNVYILTGNPITDDKFEIILQKKYIMSTDIVSYNGYPPLSIGQGSDCYVYIYKLAYGEEIQ